MAGQTRSRVLLLDPVKHRRERIAHVLGMRFDVLEAGTPKEARELVTAHSPQAIVATLRQFEGNGLIACKELRPVAGREAFFLVHGPTEAPTTPAARQQVATYHRVDTWTSAVLSPEEVDVLVWNHLVAAARAQTKRPSLLARIRAITRADVWDFLTRPRHVISTPPPGRDEEPSWLEILNGPPTFSNLRKLMTKPIF